MRVFKESMKAAEAESQARAARSSTAPVTTLESPKVPKLAEGCCCGSMAKGKIRKEQNLNLKKVKSGKQKGLI